MALQSFEPVFSQSKSRPLSANPGSPSLRLTRYSWETVLTNSGYQPAPDARAAGEPMVYSLFVGRQLMHTWERAGVSGQASI